MYLISKGFDSFDRAYLAQDKDSFNEFIAESNSYDNRIQLLETWLYRKE